MEQNSNSRCSSTFISIVFNNNGESTLVDVPEEEEMMDPPVMFLHIERDTCRHFVEFIYEK